MKRILLLLLLTASCSLAEAQNALFKRYADTQGVSTVYISKTMFRLFGGMDVDNLDIKKIANRLEHVQILSCERPSLIPTIRNEALQELKKERFELAMQMKEDGETTVIYCKQHKKNLNEFVLLNVEKDEVSVINLLGNITLKDIKQITD